MDVSIIIVNYNTPKFVEKCVESIYEQTQNIEYEIIIIDNASRTDCVANLKQLTVKYKCRLILNPKNLGFGGANNIGAKEAEGKYLFFLNSDTVLINNAVAMLFDYLETTIDNIACVGAFLEKADGRASCSFGSFPNRISLLKYAISSFVIACNPLLKMLKYRSEQNRINYKTHNSSLAVDYVCGADLMIKKSLFNVLGGYNENYFMYFEETQLQLDSTNRGFNNYVISGPRIIHYEGSSFNSGKRNCYYERRELVFDESMMTYAKKNFQIEIYIIVKMFLSVKRALPFFGKKKQIDV